MADLKIKAGAGSTNKLLIQSQDQANNDYAIQIGDAGATTLTNATMTAGTIGSSVVFPDGVVIGANQDMYSFTGDVSVGNTSEAWGPVVPLTLKKANAKIYASYEISEFYGNGSWSTIFNVVYKSSSFTAGQGNTSHGGSLLNQDTEGSGSAAKNGKLRSWASDRGRMMRHVFNQHSLGNSAGDTYYFAPETISSLATFYVNYMGSQGSVTLNVMEIS